VLTHILQRRVTGWQARYLVSTERGGGANRFFGYLLILATIAFFRMSETELLKVFTESRSEEAFAGLVQRYAGLVYSTAKRRSANAALAEDICPKLDAALNQVSDEEVGDAGDLD
jgi:hypothetical protein